MNRISVFDMLKIGVGPSSSHTLGPWRAAEKFGERIQGRINEVKSITVDLYGSLALTGKGHGTDVAVLLGLAGTDPVTVPQDDVFSIPSDIQKSKTINLLGQREIYFDPEEHIVFHNSTFLPFHSNGLRFTTFFNDDSSIQETYYSIGGGFITQEGQEDEEEEHADLRFPIDSADDIVRYCTEENHKISWVVIRNEMTWRSKSEVKEDILNIWQVMKESMYRGCHTNGLLPGGLNVKRRSAEIYDRLKQPYWEYDNVDQWITHIKSQRLGFSEILKWISCFSMAVNEENANFGRIVTAPTNGASGVIPAVLMYYICFSDKVVHDKEIIRFLLVAGEIGSIFKKGATISAAMGGCQAEIGVSSAMAAAALTEAMGGNARQALVAAEIAMEHHLGLTCDPIGGLVQIPCIERNSMGAIKAITAAHLALETIPESTKVSLDAVVKTMLETAQDMHTKYKETSTGGLATKVKEAMTAC